MVQGGKHGGSVAGPVATHILEQILAMDQGAYNPQLVALKPADNPHPFNEIAALPDYSDKAPALVAEGDESAPGDKTTGDEPDMGGNKATPDIKADADAQGSVKAALRKAATQKPVAAQPDRRNLFERFFHPHTSNQSTQPSQPTQPVGKRPHWPF
jgi:hypothetical protein